MTSMNKVFADLPVTIFEAMSQLARDNDAINLGQGFPDDPGPEDIRRAAADASVNGYNQYPSMMGIPELRRAIAAHYGRWHGLSLDPTTEVMVTSGGTEALTSAILAVVEPGDEVIVFQPVYDSYLPIIRQAGGIPRLLRLEPPDWRLTEEMLRSAFNPKTKAVLFNNPLNPAAVVYPREDLELLARFCQEFEAIAICDEVWEHVIFDGREHIPLITIPGMRDRTIKVGSAGKIFSLTGWKIGFVCAAPPLLRVAAKVHQFLTFTTAPNLQAAVAYGLGKPADYFLDMRKELARSRDRLTAGVGEHRLSGAAIAGHLFSHRRSVAARSQRDRRGLLPKDRHRLQGRGHSGIGVLREGCRDLGGAVLLRQEGRNARCRAGAAFGCGPSPIEGRHEPRPGLHADPICRRDGPRRSAAFAAPAQAEPRTVNFYNWSNYMAPGSAGGLHPGNRHQGRLRHLRRQ